MTVSYENTMTQNLEYQAKFKADTSDLSKAQAAIKQTGAQFLDLGKASGGLTVVLSNVRGALNGSITSLINMATGAGIAIQALMKLHPALAIISGLLAAGKVAFEVFNKRQEEAAEKAESAKRAIDALGLSVSELDQHLQRTKDAADAYERIQQAADNAAKAIRDMAAAQLSYNAAIAKADMANLDLDEAKALGGAKTDEERRNIKRDFAGKRAEAQTKALNEEYRLKFEQNSNERAEIVAGAKRDEEDRRSVLMGNVSDASKSIDNILAGNMRAELEVMPADSPYESEKRKQVKAIESKYAEYEAIRTAFRENPHEAAQKYGSVLGETSASEIGGIIRSLDTHKKALADFDAAAPQRAADTAQKLQVNEMERKTLAANRGAAGASIQKQLVDTTTGLDAEAAREKEAAGEKEAAKAKARKASVDAARDAASRALESDRYELMTDEEKAEHLRGQVKETRSAIGINAKAIAVENDPEKKAALQVQQGKLVQDLVSQRSEGRSVTQRIDGDREKQQKDAADRRDSISQHQAAIESIRQSRHETGLDTRQAFNHLYAVKGGKNPDEKVADNTSKMAEHLAAIAKLMEGAAA